jgi:hypothetical protein
MVCPVAFRPLVGESFMAAEHMVKKACLPHCSQAAEKELTFIRKPLP